MWHYPAHAVNNFLYTFGNIDIIVKKVTSYVIEKKLDIKVLFNDDIKSNTISVGEVHSNFFAMAFSFHDHA